MSTKNPRISVMLTPGVAVMLQNLSRLTGSSQSAIVGDLLSESLPVFKRMVAVLEKATKLRQEGLQESLEIPKAMQRVQERLEGQLGLMIDEFRDSTVDLVDAVEKSGIARRKGAGAPSAPSVSATTPISNRGVRSPNVGRNRPKSPPSSRRQSA